MADEYIRLDTTIIAIDNLINEAATGTMARTLFKAKDTIYSQQRYFTDVQPVNRWISIEESKPKDMQQVLAVVDGDAREAFYNAGCFIGSNFYRSINEVKWWQPLPEPPKESDTE